MFKTIAALSLALAFAPIEANAAEHMHMKGHMQQVMITDDGHVMVMKGHKMMQMMVMVNGQMVPVTVTESANGQ